MTSRRAAAVLLFLGGVAISSVTILRGVDPFDEGLALQAARRVAQGQVPYRDFLWAYGPAQIYILGGLFKLFGTSLLQWRILRALVDGAVALAVFVLARREVGPRWALAAWLAAATVMAQPRTANPFAVAFLFTLLALIVATGGGSPRRRLVGAALLTAAAAAFRLDFAGYAAASVAMVLFLRDRPVRAATYVGATVGLTAAADRRVPVGASRFVTLVGHGTPGSCLEAIAAGSGRRRSRIAAARRPMAGSSAPGRRALSSGTRSTCSTSTCRSSC